MATEKQGSFTLPGEAGYEDFTLQMAKRWGADVIRDSDGTVLSSNILNAGFGIYSTICMIRDHNEWAKNNQDKLQQSFLMTQPVVAAGTSLNVELLKDYFTDQFQINEQEDSVRYWQVFDRTDNCEVPRENWSYCPQTKSVCIQNTISWHRYTVNFLAYRIWEEISMYNHTTNHWDKDHLMQIDPRYPETQEYLLQWMENWCRTHPDTTVVRFTSMFYNFVWIWGSSERNRSLFSDWGSYDFTVSPLALDKFQEKFGYALTSEDFIHQGKLNATHIPPTSKKLDWISFINEFVVSFGKKLIQIVHHYQKQAYVFYDDSWIGVEPYSSRFSEFGFDGIIKCVFSGFEVRLCSGVRGVKTHELRLHPYLFPVGLGGAPTFMEGGNPTHDAKVYWNHIRRALLRSPIDRIGLGGYLHLVQDFPDFCDYIEKIADEFRKMKELYEKGKPYCLKPKVGILTSWGKLRPWSCSGHYHENPGLDLINILESLSGLPFEVEFFDFEEIKKGVPQEISIIINAGFAGSAWSGGTMWCDNTVVEVLTQWVYEGGAFLGVNEPSAVAGYDTFFRMAHILGVDEDNGERICHGRWPVEACDDAGILPAGSHIAARPNIYLTNDQTRVFAQHDGLPVVTCNEFGRGKGLYLSSYHYSLENTRLLLNAILYACSENMEQPFITDNLYTECAYFGDSNLLVVINNSDREQTTSVNTGCGEPISVTIAPYDTVMVQL